MSTSTPLLPLLAISMVLVACVARTPAAIGPAAFAPPPPAPSIAIAPADWATADSLAVDVHGAIVLGFDGARIEAVDPRAEMERRGEACSLDPDCAQDVARTLGAEKVVRTKLATLGGTVLVRVSVVDVTSGTRDEERQEVVNEATPERVSAAITLIAKNIAEPYRPAPPPPAPPEQAAWFEQWWVWTLVGAAVVGTGVGVGAAVVTQEEGPDVVVTPP